MFISDEEAKDLKTWIIKKLEDISDADSDVLADYVLALIRADTPEPELRANAIENLEDFLKDNTTAFIDQVYLAIHTKSYIPGYVAPPVPAVPIPAFTPSSGPVAYGNTSGGSGHDNGLHQSRKRSYNDRQDERGGFDTHYGRGNRNTKQIRRGESRGGMYQGRPDSNISTPVNLPGLSPSSVPGFPALPTPPPGMPFDPNDPLGAILAMQAMGFPPITGIPSLTQSRSMAGFPQPGNQISNTGQPMGKNRVNARCRDYDTKGFCTRGNACPFDHGTNHITVLPQQGGGEYDPNDPSNSLMLDTRISTNGSNDHQQNKPRRGGLSERSRGSRGDRGGYNPQRRNNRAEFSQAGPNHDRNITTVVVEQIPEDHFDEQSVRDFFTQFGEIVEISMQAYKRLATVKYKDYLSAKSAYESPKVIFDNRFVKVYWYNPDTVPTTTNGSAPKGTSPTASSKPEEPAYDMEKFQRDAEAAQKKLEERKALQRETETKKLEIEKQKEELERKKAEEKRKLEELLKAKGLSSTTMEIDSTSDVKQEESGSPQPKESAQTAALRAQLAALEEEAKSLGLDPEPWASSPRGRGRGRGRGSYRGWEAFAGRGGGYDPRGGYRGRGGPRGRGGGIYNLDNRPKKVKIEGVHFDDAKDEAVRQYLLGIGDFEAVEMTNAREAMTVSFKDRFTAEKFMYGGKAIPGVGKVELAWVSTPLPPVRAEQIDANGDTDMGLPNATTEGNSARDSGQQVAEVDYDVAEEDERWMVS